jgi:HAE1 family hydrophobic/amphiphilic exporter-1
LTASGAGAAARVSIGITVFSGMIASTCLAVALVPVFYVEIQTWVEKRQAKHEAKLAARLAAHLVAHERALAAEKNPTTDKL